MQRKGAEEVVLQGKIHGEKLGRPYHTIQYNYIPEIRELLQCRFIHLSTHFPSMLH